MASRRALIVDDSKTARVTLARMLQKHGLDSDQVESGPAALEYLRETRPDVIFLDHMMPDMDGFEAIQAIKRNPATATIPIMMYTSKEGDLYLGQARALGALGILPKQVQPAELFEALKGLGLATDRRGDDRGSPAGSNERVRELNVPDRVVQSIANQTAAAVRSAMPPVRSLLDDQRAALRAELEAHADDVSTRAARKIYIELLENDQLIPGVSLASVVGVKRRWASAALLGALLLFPAVWFFGLYAEAQAQRDIAVGEKAWLMAAMTRPKPALVANPSHSVAAAAPAGSPPPSWLTALEWAVNQHAGYAYDALALDDRRATLLRGLIARLAAAGFKGRIHLETRAGQYCLVGSAVDGYRLPPDELPVEACDVVGAPRDFLPEAGEKESLDFANFVAGSPRYADDTISIEVISHGYEDPLEPYPDPVSGLTAGNWNAAARANNQVLVRLLPASEQAY